MNDLEYMKYLVLFRIWKKSYWKELTQYKTIVERAAKFMCPSPSLKTNPNFQFLPPKSIDTATAFYVDQLNISTNALKKVN